MGEQHLVLGILAMIRNASSFFTFNFVREEFAKLIRHCDTENEIGSNPKI